MSECISDEKTFRSLSYGDCIHPAAVYGGCPIKRLTGWMPLMQQKFEVME